MKLLPLFLIFFSSRFLPSIVSYCRNRIVKKCENTLVLTKREREKWFSPNFQQNNFANYLQTKN